MITVLHDIRFIDRSTGRGALRTVLYAGLIGIASTLVGCGTPKETVSVLLDDNAMSDYQYEAMRARSPNKSRDALEDDWDRMTRDERENVTTEYTRSRFPLPNADQILRENMQRLYGPPGGGGEGGGGGGGGGGD